MNLMAQQQTFTRHVRDGVEGNLGTMPASRMAVYRRLVKGNIEAYLAKVLKQTVACLGEEKWQEALTAFLARAEMTSPYYRDLPAEFITWAATQTWVDFPLYWLELAHFEALQIALVFAPDVTAQSWLQPCAVGGYTHPVQAWKEAQDMPTATTFVCVFRDQADKVKWLPISPLQARFIELAQGISASTQEAVLAQLQQELPGAEVAEAVRHLRQQGVILA